MVRKALGVLSPPAVLLVARRRDVQRRLAVLTAELEQLAAAVATGGRLETLLEAIRTREEPRAALRGGLVAMGHTMDRRERARVERDILAEIAEWRGALPVAARSRDLLRHIVVGRMTFTPRSESSRQ